MADKGIAPPKTGPAAWLSWLIATLAVTICMAAAIITSLDSTSATTNRRTPHPLPIPDPVLAFHGPNDGYLLQARCVADDDETGVSCGYEFWTTSDGGQTWLGRTAPDDLPGITDLNRVNLS